jgi:hypothetical protein
MIKSSIWYLNNYTKKPLKTINKRINKQHCIQIKKLSLFTQNLNFAHKKPKHKTNKFIDWCNQSFLSLSLLNNEIWELKILSRIFGNKIVMNKVNYWGAGKKAEWKKAESKRANGKKRPNFFKEKKKRTVRWKK